MKWDPWRQLASMPGVRLEWASLAQPGLTVQRDGETTIYIDFRLPRREREAALAHELVHVERGILFDDSTPPALIELEERTVRRVVAERLAPPEELDRLIRTATQADIDVTATTVAEWFDIEIEVAGQALTLAATRALSRHPSLRRPQRLDAARGSIRRRLRTVER